MTEPPVTLRFAVATFDTQEGLHNALQNLSQDGLPSETFSCLCLQHLLADSGSSALLPTTSLQELVFPQNAQPISCTVGILAQRLLARHRAGAPTLKAALSHWLIPRHAGQIEDAIELGRIVLWVQLFDSDSEHRAYRSLLAGSSNSVGVHDLVAE